MDFLSTLLALPALKSEFSGDSSPYLKQQKQLAAQQQQISGALTDTNNPLYQQLYGQYQQQNHNNLASVIAEAQGQNRMATGMGRTPLFDPSRGGETIFRSLMQGYQDSGAQSDQQTRQALLGAAGVTESGLKGYNSITPYGRDVNSQKLAGYKGVSDLLNGQNSSMPSYQPGYYPTYNNPGTNNITWNQQPTGWGGY